jgi:hypothetical protein
MNKAYILISDYGYEGYSTPHAVWSDSPTVEQLVKFFIKEHLTTVPRHPFNLEETQSRQKVEFHQWARKIVEGTHITYEIVEMAFEE